MSEYWRTLFKRQLNPYRPTYAVTAVDQPAPVVATVSQTPLGFQTLAFSSTTFVRGTPSSGTILNATGGSLIVGIGLPAGLVIDSLHRTWAWDGSGSGTASGSFTLYENIPGASSNPNLSAISYSIGTGVAYTAWFGTTDATTGWITLPLGASNRRVWQGPGGSDAANGLSYANRKLTWDAAWLAYFTGHTAGDQLMIAGGQTLNDGGLNGTMRDLASGTQLNPNAIITYNAAAPTDATQYGRQIGSAKTWLTIPDPATKTPNISMPGNTGSGYFVVQGLDFDGQDQADAVLSFASPHNYLGFQNCRFKGVRLVVNAASGAPGTVTYGHHVLVSKCSGWGQWNTDGNMSWLYIQGVDNYVEEDIVGGHCGWSMSSTRGGSVSTGSPNIFGHGRYFSAENSTTSAANGISRRAVWFDSAADGDNDRGGMAREQTVVINDPIAGQNGGFSVDFTEAPNGVLITAKDGLVMGGNDIDDGTLYPRGGGYGNQNTLPGSGMDNYAFLDNPKFQTASGNDILLSPQNSTGMITNQTFAMSRIRAYKAYSHLIVTSGTTPANAHVTWNDVITDPEAGAAPGTACSTWGAAPVGYQTLVQLASSMGFSTVQAAYNAMLTWPHLPWAQAWLTLGLPSMGLFPSWANVLPPDISALGAPLAIYPTTAPTLSLPTGTSTGATTATVGATTDRATGKLYYVVTTSSTQPTKAQIRAGQNAAGSAAVASGSQIVTSTGVQTENATGLTASTAYFVHLMHEDQYPVSLQSNISTSASFTTSAGSSFASFSSASADKYSAITLTNSNLTATPGNIGDWENVRANRASGSGTTQFDVTLGTIGLQEVGVDDGTVNYSVLGAQSITGGHGVIFRSRPADNGWAVQDGTGFAYSSTNGTQVPVAGDIISVVINRTAGTLKFFWTHSGTTILLATYTFGSSGGAYPAFTNYYAFFNGQNVADAVTANFGATSLVNTGTGAGAY